MSGAANLSHVPSADVPGARSHPAAALVAVRAATAERHARLDQGLPVASPAAGLAEYRAHLQAVHAWLAPLEAWLSGFDDGPQDPLVLAPLPRAGRIAADLRDLAARGLGAGEPIGPDRRRWPTNADASFRWGVAYVIEGSQLGGQLLARQLAGRLDAHVPRYLSGDGMPTRWPAFVAAFAAALDNEAAIDAACRGACAAFDRLSALALPRPPRGPARVVDGVDAGVVA